MRDNFPKRVQRILADRVNSHCSNPDCAAQTRGPHSDADAAVNIGVAAHITAASPGGPRFDSSLSASERKHFSNGVWLCENCAKLIDSDSARYTVDAIRKWKAEAEQRTRAELGQPRDFSRGSLAIVSRARRFGAETNVLVEGRVVPIANASAPTDTFTPTWFASRVYVAQFKIHKRRPRKYIIVDEIRVTVYEKTDIPAYKPLYGAYPAETSLYTVVIDAPAKGERRQFSAERFFEVTAPQTSKEHRFSPLVIDSDIPAIISLRINSAQPGLYWISAEVAISSGTRQECHTPLRLMPIIYEPYDPYLEAINRGLPVPTTSQ